MKLLPGRTRLLLPLVLLLAWSALGSAAAVADVKGFTAEVAPHSVTAGSERAFTATLTNASSQQQLGSANVVGPAGVTIAGASPPSVGGAVRGTATVRDGVLELRDLEAPPGATVTVELTADVGCDAQDGHWSVVAKQANKFNGPPGNDLTLIDRWQEHVTDLSLDVLPCSEPTALQFVTQPADAEIDTVITSVAGDPAAPSIQVEVVDGAGQRVEDSDALISLSLTGEPAAAKLTGNTAAAVDGVASFPSLEIDSAGRDYALTATAEGLTPATSDTFSIWDDLKICTVGVLCRGEVTGDDMGAETTTTSATPGLLAMSLGVDDVACGDSANHAPEVLTLDPRGLDGTATVTITISKEHDQQQSNNGVSFYEVCFQGDAKPGETEPPPAYLLPLCTSPLPSELAEPCLASRTKTQAGAVLLVVHMPTIDPKMI